MTIQQLLYVLEVTKTGSVSKAARNLYLSQPNLSNAIKNLEHELGITIFERTTMGMQLTGNGQRLVQKAASIMEDIADITSGMNEGEECSFRLVYPRYVPAFEAFMDLCRKYEEMPHLHFSCFIGDGERQVEALYRNLCDLAVYLDYGSSNFRRLCLDLHVKYEIFKKTKFYIQLSENHPLLKEEKFDVGKLRDYPYVAFADLLDRDAYWMPWEEIVNPDRLICVQSTSSRASLVANSNAFSIVLPHSDEYNREHGVVQLPFENKTVTVGVLYSMDRKLSPFAKEYLDYLKLRMDF